MDRACALLGMVLMSILLASCQATKQPLPQEPVDSSASMPIIYRNSSMPGPQVVVLPGTVQGVSATVAQQVTGGNLSDFGEQELAKANFQVLDRKNVSNYMDEYLLAVKLGDPDAVKLFKDRILPATRWLVTFDILKNEPVASAKQGFSGEAIGALLSMGMALAGHADAGRLAGTVVSSVKASESSSVSVIGLRYKVIDAGTGAQAATGYFEDKLEVKEQQQSVLGIGQQKKQMTGIDSTIQRLVQKAVQEIDAAWKGGTAPVVAEPEKKAGSVSGKAKAKDGRAQEDKIIAAYQQKVQQQKQDAREVLALVKQDDTNDGMAMTKDSLNKYCAEIRVKLEEFIEKMNTPEFKRIMEASRELNKNNVSEYQIVEQDQNTCAVRMIQHNSFYVEALQKTVTSVNMMTILAVKEQGHWKICGAKPS